jgi:predicted lipoprotein with Yx(FWY)xxD motif
VPSNHRSNAAHVASPLPWLVATAAAVATLAALSVLVLLHPGASHAAAAKGTVVSTASTKLGRILVDSRGRTLYLFEKDKHGKSACSGACAQNWPPLLTKGKPKAGTGAKSSLLGTTKRSDGTTQVTYNKHPLYTFVADNNKPGSTKGEGIDAFGARWYVVAAKGTAKKGTY